MTAFTTIPPVTPTTIRLLFLFFFFNDTATTEIYTLSLHDALPICCMGPIRLDAETPCACRWRRSEEHTSELQSRVELVCRLLLEKKKKYGSFNLCCVKKLYEHLNNTDLYAR